MCLGAFGTAALADPGKGDPPPACDNGNDIVQQKNKNCDGAGRSGGSPAVDDDGDDNCAWLANHDRTDLDENGTGDACQTFVELQAGCASVPGNEDSAPINDGVDDACDGDYDNDGEHDFTDNCPSKENARQADRDADGSGDACDSDLDNDGLPDDVDDEPNNPFEPEQEAADITGAAVAAAEGIATAAVAAAEGVVGAL